MACELLPTLWIESYSYTDYNEVIGFLKKYEQNSKNLNHNTLRGICQIILKGRQCEVSQLSETISNDLVSRIEETIDDLNYLVPGSQQKSPEEALKWLQFREETDIEFAIATPNEGFHEFWKKVNTAFSTFRPKVTLKTLEAWKRKAKKIIKETSHSVIFSNFNYIDQPFLKIENIVSEAVFEYDEYINSQIHD